MIQSQCQQVNFAYLVCEAPPHFFDGYTIHDMYMNLDLVNPDLVNLNLVKYLI